MSKTVQRNPQLMILAANAQAVNTRFDGWPDLLLPEDLLRQTVVEPGQLTPEQRDLLATKGLLAEKDGTLHLTIPVYEKLPTSQWQEWVDDTADSHLPGLREAVTHVCQSWQSQAEAAPWEDVAHSLLISYLLWSAGGQMLLKLSDAAAATAVTHDPGTTDAIWQGFVRYNQQYGVSYLLGAKYEHSLAVRDLLRRQDIALAMATLTSERRLTATEPSARRSLNSLAALGGDRAGDGSESSIWPVISAADLRVIKPSLLLALKALKPLLQELAAEVTTRTAEDQKLFRTADLTLVAYALLVRRLADDWQGSALLPTVVQPVPGF